MRISSKINARKEIRFNESVTKEKDMIKQFIFLSFVMAVGICADDGLKVADLNSVNVIKRLLSN